ncbi:MAG: class I SAM-dependent methyltransferase [Elusimicrobia bacterium]|nr:class I SAM-dependent methyltransferase [Elusimicrobiota bacterium]
MKSPGPEWYERIGNSDLYKTTDAFDDCLGWNHRRFLDSEFPAGKRLLDIGCGRGLFLKEADRKGFKVSGIDFDRENIALCQKRFGLCEVYPMDLAQFTQKYPERKYDVITFFEVLEHQDDPGGFLKNIRCLLAPGGRIALSVPNRLRAIESLAEVDRAPYHLTKWSPKALRHILQKHGFTILQLEPKTLDGEDLSGWIRLGIAGKIVQRARNQKDAGKMLSRAAFLQKLKRNSLRYLFLPFTPFARLLKLQGPILYCLARLDS